MVIKDKLIQNVHIVDADYNTDEAQHIKLTFIAEMKNVIDSIGYLTPMRKVEDRKTDFNNPVYFDVVTDRMQGKMYICKDIDNVNLCVDLHVCGNYSYLTLNSMFWNVDNEVDFYGCSKTM